MLIGELTVPAVVGGKDNDCVVRNAVFIERIKEPTDVPVHRFDHRRVLRIVVAVALLALIRSLGHGFDRLDRRVHVVERQV